MSSPTYSSMDLNAFGPMTGSTHQANPPQTDHSFILSALNPPAPPGIVKPKPSALTAVTNGIGPIHQESEEGRESEADRAGYLFGRQYNELRVMGEHGQEDGGMNDTQNALDELFGEGTATNHPVDENQEIQIDPALSSAVDTVPLVIDSSTLPQTPESPNQTQNKGTKRKATSRANMIARGAACEFCKKRKLKCSAEVTGCMACIRVGKECVYSQKKQRSRVRILEDRLMDLEKRLGVQDEGEEGAGGNGEQVGGGDGTGMYISPATTLEDTPGGTSSEQWNLFGALQAKTTEMGFTLGGLGKIGIEDKQSELDAGITEPDLMTLADAAASNNQPGQASGKGQQNSQIHAWTHLDSEEISHEIVSAVDGGKGVGEKIILHLLPLYMLPDLSGLHRVVPPTTLLARFKQSANNTATPHPSLLLAILSKLLQYSSSPALSSPSHCQNISTRLRFATHLSIQQAITTADPRALDILSAKIMLAHTATEESRYLDSWHVIGGLAASAWSTGLGKLGGVSQRYVGGDAGWEERVRREGKLRDVRRRTVLVEPPRDLNELGERISLFWSVYIYTTIACVGWNCPSTIIEEEITTPFPKDNYDLTDNARDMRTINDFIAGNANTGSEDSNAARQVKVLCLLSRVTRLFDMSLVVYKPELASTALRLIKSYIASLPRITAPVSSGEKISPLCQVYESLYAAMMLCYLREEIDASLGDEVELMNKAVEAGEKVVTYLDMSYQAGDTNLDDYDLLGCAMWGLVGRTSYRLAVRFERDVHLDGTRMGNIQRLRDIGGRMTEACHILGKRIKFSEVQAQLLENYSVGAEAKLGECERVDYVAVDIR